MNRFNKKFFALLGAVTFTLAALSCGNISEDDSENYAGGKTGGELSANKGRLSVSLSGDERSATILPEDVTKDDITKAELLAKKGDEEAFLLGEWETGSVSAIAAMEADSTLSLEPSIYSFTLKLYVTQKDRLILCQTGSIENREIISGNNTLSFETDYASESTGNLSVKFSFKKEQYIEKITVSLMPLGESDKFSVPDEIYAYDKEKDEDEISVSYARAGLESGSYILHYELYGLVPEAREVIDDEPPINTFEKLVKIAAGCTTSTTISFYNEDGKSVVNSFYSLNLVYPKDVSFFVDMPQEENVPDTVSTFGMIGERISLPRRFDVTFKKNNYRTLLGWSLSETLEEGDELFTDAIVLNGDTTLYAQFHDGLLISADDLLLRDILELSSLFRPVIDSGDRKVPVKIDGKIKLEPLGDNWRKDIRSDINKADRGMSASGRLKYTSESFEKLAFCLTMLKMNGIRVSLDLSETGIEYLPMYALKPSMPFMPNQSPSLPGVSRPDSGLVKTLPDNEQPVVSEPVPSMLYELFNGPSNISELILPESCEVLLPFSLNINAQKYTVPAHVKSLCMEALAPSISEVDFEEDSLCEELISTPVYFDEPMPEPVVRPGPNIPGGFRVGLVSFTIPAKVKTLPDEIFAGRESLSVVKFQEESLCEYIGNGAFSRTGITAIIIPAKVKVLNADAFYECSNLRKVSFEEGSELTSIGEAAFSGCNSLTSITLPEGLEYIGKYAFDGCESLTSLALPEGLTSIGEGTFFDCDSLASLALPKGLAAIGKEAFASCDSLASLALPESLTEIGEDAFARCNNLSTLSGYVGNYAMALENCDRAYDNLLTVNVKGSIESNGEEDFFTDLRTCLENFNGKFEENEGVGLKFNLSELTGLSSIPENALKEVYGLTGLSLPESIREIGIAAFKDCYDLASLTCSTGIAKDAILACTGNFNPSGFFEHILIVHIKGQAYNGFIADVTEAMATDGVYKSIILDLSGVTGLSEDELSAYAPNTTTSITVPKSKTEFEADEYSQYIFLETLNCDSSNAAEAIKACTGNCASRSEKGYLTVKVSGEAYEGFISGVSEAVAESRHNIYLDLSELTNLTEIEKNAFKYIIPLVGIKLPSSLTSIGTYAFAYSKIKDILIPESVETIGESAFRACGYLESVTFGGSSAQWAMVQRGTEWHKDVAAKVITCSNKSVPLDYDGILDLTLYVEKSQEPEEFEVFEGTSLKDLREEVEKGVAEGRVSDDQLFIFSRLGYKKPVWKNEYMEIFDEETPIYEDLKLMAEWEPIEYSIKYELDGGTNSENNPETFNVETVFKLENPTKKGYVFTGWYAHTPEGEEYLVTDIIGDDILFMSVSGVSEISNFLEVPELPDFDELTLYATWAEAGSSIVVEVADNGDIEISNVPAETDDVICLEADEGYTSYSWLIEGLPASQFEGASVSEDGRRLSIDKSAILEGAVYQISLSAMKGFIPYGAQISVKR